MPENNEIKVCSIFEFNKLSRVEKFDYIDSIDHDQVNLLRLRWFRNGAFVAQQELDLLVTYIDKLAQPFAPKFMSQIFEGMNMLTNKFEPKHIIIENDMIDDSIQFYPDSDAYTIGEIQYPILPNTLDDFRNDCERAGIELFWRIK